MDNSFVIKNLLTKDEGTRLEFKSIVSKAEIGKIITSLINTEGGDLVIGVEDNKDIVGVENAEKLIISLRKMLTEQIKPEAPISIQIIHYKKKDLILISTWEGAKKPYQYKSKIYIRENDNTKISDFDTISDLILERKNADFHWERRTVLSAKLEDLVHKEIDKTIELYKERSSKLSFENDEDFLIYTGLIKNGNLTNACVLLFAKKPMRYIPQSSIRVTVYPSNKTEDRFLNDRTFDDSLFENILDVLEFLDVIFGKTIEINGNEREETLNYPQLAIREALMNAIVHRDYSSVNSFLQINVFSNRTEISNYGRLPEGITIPDLRKEHSSILRNPDIAQICFTRRYIEMLGSGTLRMISDCRKNGFKDPKWKEDDKEFKVIFEGVNHTSSKKALGEGVSEGVNEGVNNLYYKELSEGVNMSLNEVYNVLNNYPEINVTEIAQRIGKGISTTERYIKILKDKEVIVFIGSPRTGGYVLKKQL